MKIAIASGKGGTGKTLVATNLAYYLSRQGEKVTFLDCDVEEPDGHLFLKPEIKEEKKVLISTPVGIDEKKCIACRRCSEVCHYNAITLINDKVLFLDNLCHACFACVIVCPEDAIIVREREVGELKSGKRDNIDVFYGLLRIGEVGMTPRIISRVKENIGSGITILDSPPGTACPAVETIKKSDLCVLVSDPTPFSINDLKLSVDMCREIGIEPVVFVNRGRIEANRLTEYCKDEELEIVGNLPDDRKIAEAYSRAELVIEALPGYEKNFEEFYANIKERLAHPPSLKRKKEKKAIIRKEREKELFHPVDRKLKELVVISGKGGTGKTSLVGCFAILSENKIISDCDVDAADLHLILKPQILFSDIFSAGVDAVIDQEKCTQCGICAAECRFNSIELDSEGKYYIPPIECEGCGVCSIVCPAGAIITTPAENGIWYVSDTRAGRMAHAKLNSAEENSGRLVSLLRRKAVELAKETDETVIIDGSPGTGCPVISSISGASYALIITEPTPSGLYDLGRIIDVTRYFNVPAGVVVNKYDINPEMTDKIEQLTAEKKVEFIGRLPYSEVFTRAQIHELTAVEFSDDPVIDGIKEIWHRVREKF